MSDIGHSPESAHPQPVDYDLTTISTAEDPYGEVDRIYSELLSSSELSDLRLQVLDDQRGLLEAIGYGAMDPDEFSKTRRITRVRIATRIIDHNKANMPGYSDEEESWTRILNPIFNELVSYETRLGATDAKQMAAHKMADVLKTNVESRGKHRDTGIQGTKAQEPKRGK